MKQYPLGTTVGAARRALAIVIALLAISGAVYLGNHPLKMDGYIGQGGACTSFYAKGQRVNFPMPADIHLSRAQSCALGRYAWQAPLAFLLGLAGLGMAGLAARRPRPRRAHPPRWV